MSPRRSSKFPFSYPEVSFQFPLSGCLKSCLFLRSCFGSRLRARSRIKVLLITRNSHVSMDASAEPTEIDRAQQPVSFKFIRDCQAWFASLSQQDVTNQPPLQRLETALKCLQAPPSRQRKTEIQRLTKGWGVVQKTKNATVHGKNSSRMNS